MKIKKSSLETIIPDEEWQEFVKWWKSRYLDSPSKPSVVVYLQWKRSKDAGISLRL